MGILDAHVHLWDTSVFPLPWLAKVPELAQHYDYRDIASPLADGVICVQAGESLAEAQWLLAQAAQFPSIKSVVLQFEASDVAGEWAGTVHPALAQSMADGGPVAGVRIPARGVADDLEAIPGITELCEGLVANNLVLELLIRPSQLLSVDRLAKRFPELRVVLCHMGIGADPIEAGWEDDLALVAAHPNVHAKISGILSLTGDTIRPNAPGRIVRAALASFGTARLMFGSDWPMSSRTGLDYAGVIAAVDAEFTSCSEKQQAELRGGTARAVYGLQEKVQLSAVTNDGINKTQR